MGKILRDTLEHDEPKIKYLELIKRLLGMWNIKIKVKEVGIKFQKKAGKFLEIDIRLLNV